MATITVISRDGESKQVEAQNDISLMETIRDNGFDDLLALCGGCCSCATCHVYVEEKAIELLPAISDDEDDLLESSEHRQPNSRLSCQLIVSDIMDGLVFKIADED